MARPTDDFSWAPTPTDPDPATGDVVEPAAKRAAGWQENDPLPFNNMNWIQRMVGRWLDWFDSRFTPSGELTLGATNGSLAVDSDTASVFAFRVVQQLSPPGVGQLRANDVVAETHRMNTVLNGLEATGDVQWTGERVGSTGAARIVAGVAPSHGTLTSVGLSAPVIAPTLSAPADADQEAAYPRDQALYLTNLVKLGANVRIAYDGSGVPSVSGTVNGHNVASATLAATSGSFPNNGLVVAMTDASQPSVVLATRGFVSAEASREFILEATPLTNGARVGVKWYNTSTNLWVDALGTVASLANTSLEINLIAI